MVSDKEQHSSPILQGRRLYYVLFSGLLSHFICVSLETPRCLQGGLFTGSALHHHHLKCTVIPGFITFLLKTTIAPHLTDQAVLRLVLVR